jgi:PAS domain S-box-containing protein
MRSEDDTTSADLLPSLLLDTAPDAMVVVGADEVIKFVNVQTESLFGYLRSELLGQHLELLIPERFRSRHAAHLSLFVANPGARPMGSGIRLFGRRKDGSGLPIEVSLSPLRTPQGITVSASIRDISERRQLEEAARLGDERRAEDCERRGRWLRRAAPPRASSCPR